MSAPRTALVTGASSGIGAATAVQLATAGVEVVVVARREAELAEVAAAAAAAGGTAHVVATDLSRPGAVAATLTRTRALVGEVDALVCCAATVRLSMLHECDDRTWERQLHLNLTVPFELARAVLPGMRERRCGWIVNVSSGVAQEVVPGSGAYGVSKAALNRLTELLHAENRDHGVHVHAVCPGWVATALAAAPSALGIDPAQVLRPDDVAAVVRWLLDQPAHVAVGPVVRVEPRASEADAATAMGRFVRSRPATGVAPTEVPT